jgi:hypothetical protein
MNLISPNTIHILFHRLGYISFCNYNTEATKSTIRYNLIAQSVCYMFRALQAHNLGSQLSI